jgi:hypothetical protein
MEDVNEPGTEFVQNSSYRSAAPSQDNSDTLTMRKIRAEQCMTVALKLLVWRFSREYILFVQRKI